MMQNIKSYLYMLGLLLVLSVIQVSAQDIPELEDSTLHGKNFLNYQSISPFGKELSVKNSTYSVSTIKSEEIRTMNTPALGNALAGRLTGLSVSQNGGAPGVNDATLRIRGVQTFVDPSMMVVVDGFQTEWNTLLPDEIESIHVLKDAASLAMYGISGANGVLYIKTKRGVARGKDLITFNSRVSFQQPGNMPEFLNNGEYAELYNIAMVNDGRDIASGIFSSQEIVDYYKNGTFPDLYSDVNWYNEIVKPSTITQDYNLSINGGNQGARYNVLLGYVNTPGLYKGLDGMNNSNWVYDRYVARINLDVEITDWLRAQVSTRGMIGSTKQPMIGQDTIWNSMSKFLPYNVKTQTGEWGGKENFELNPVAQIQQKGYSLQNSRSIDADVKLIADLPFLEGASVFGQIVFSNYYYSYFNKSRDFSYLELFPDPMNPGVIDTSIIKGTVNSNFEFAQPSGTQWNRSNMLGGAEYNKDLGNGVLYASAIYQRELYTTSYLLNQVPWAKINLFGRVNYSHMNKYIAEFGYSYSGTDNYAPESRFGFFPSVSAAWIISNENFLQESSRVNFLKIRASYGLVGNDRIGSLRRFMFNEYYGSPLGGYRLGNSLTTTQGTYESTALVNMDATWEKAYKANIGVDAQLFNKLSFSADYFFENREDIFVDPGNNLSVLIGGRYNQLNLGSAKNSGVEFEMNFQDNLGAFNYYFAPRLSIVNTEAVELGEAPQAFDYLYRKGNPIYQPFVLEAIGFFADQAEIDNSPFQTYGTVKPGDLKYKDQNNDGFIDNNDVVAKGYTAYPGMIYSFDAGFAFKGFDFSVFFQGVGRRTISLLSQDYMIPFLNEVKPTEWIRDNYWTPERGNNALYPRLTTQENPNNYQASTFWQRDGSYLRIRNVELGYNLPATLTRRFKAEGLRIYLNAVNPLTWHKITEIDIDPEINNPFSYPAMKSYNIGLSLNF
jgi:TonB-linked SusC/RagA family outer membrane protein